MTLEVERVRARDGVPDVRGPRVGARDESPAISAPAHVELAPRKREAPKLCASRRVPDANRVVESGRRKPSAVGAECRGAHTATVVAFEPQQSAGGEIARESPTLFAGAGEHAQG